MGSRGQLQSHVPLKDGGYRGAADEVSAFLSPIVGQNLMEAASGAGETGGQCQAGMGPPSSWEEDIPAWGFPGSR